LLSDEELASMALTAEQLAAWQAIQKDREAMQERLHDEREEVRAAVMDELRTSNPDLDSVFSLIDGGMEAVRAELSGLRERSLALYSSLDERQRGIVASAILEKMQHMEQWRQHGPDRRGFHGRG